MKQIFQKLSLSKEKQNSIKGGQASGNESTTETNKDGVIISDLTVT